MPIDFPTAAGNVNVACPPGSSTGILCQCSGHATRFSTYLASIYIKNAMGSPGVTPAAPVCNITTMMTQPYVQIRVNAFTPANPGYAWNADRQVSAFAEAAPAAQNNSLTVLYQYYVQGSPGQMAEVDDCENKSFYGFMTADCGMAAAPAPEVELDERFPSKSDDGWLLYEGLSLSPLYNGNKLMTRSGPLSANVIAVSVPRVYWWYTSSIGTTLVRRAAGGLTLADAMCLFPGMPRDAIFLWQDLVPSYPRGIITSECRENPDVFSVEAEDVIRVLPNISYPSMSTLRGSFDLWVKVIS